MAVITKRQPGPAAPALAATTETSRYVWATARIVMGWMFLWAFVDKVFGLGYATEAGKGWIDGGEPTRGFLAGGAAGPFKGLYNSIAGAGWADTLFMVGLFGIGVALLLGIGMRLAAASGALLLVLMWTVALPPANNPIIDDHIVLALLVIGLAAVKAGDTFGFGRWWSELPLVKRYPVLR